MIVKESIGIEDDDESIVEDIVIENKVEGEASKSISNRKDNNNIEES